MATSNFEELIVELKKSYKTAIVTHNLQQAGRISDYTGDEWKVLANIEPNFRLIFVTDALTGYRAGELLAFRWLNFDPEAGTLQATHGLYNGRLIEGVKTARSSKPLKIARVLTLMLEEHRAASEWKEGENFIFSRSDGRPFDPSFLREKVLY